MDHNKYKEFFDRCVRELQSTEDKLVTSTNKYDVIIKRVSSTKPQFRVYFRKLGAGMFESLFEFSSSSKLLLEFGAEQAFLYAQDLISDELVHFDQYDSFLRSFTVQK